MCCGVGGVVDGDPSDEAGSISLADSLGISALLLELARKQQQTSQRAKAMEHICVRAYMLFEHCSQEYESYSFFGPV